MHSCLHTAEEDVFSSAATSLTADLMPSMQCQLALAIPVAASEVPRLALPARKMAASQKAAGLMADLLGSSACYGSPLVYPLRLVPCPTLLKLQCLKERHTTVKENFQALFRQTKHAEAQAEWRRMMSWW